jgi:hypothetical protein
MLLVATFVPARVDFANHNNTHVRPHYNLE